MAKSKAETSTNKIDLDYFEKASLAMFNEVDKLETIPDISDELNRAITWSYMFVSQLADFLNENYETNITENHLKDMWKVKVGFEDPIWAMKYNVKVAAAVTFLLTKLSREVTNSLPSNKTCSSDL